MALTQPQKRPEKRPESIELTPSSLSRHWQLRSCTEGNESDLWSAATWRGNSGERGLQSGERGGHGRGHRVARGRRGWPRRGPVAQEAVAAAEEGQRLQVKQNLMLRARAGGRQGQLMTTVFS